MEGRVLDFVALGVLIIVLITLLYAVIYIHDIPYEIAKKRNHPHQDAIHTAGWVSLFLLHVLWPFLWIWATLYKPERGWGMLPDDSSGGRTSEEVDALKERVTLLEEKLEAVLDQKEELPVEEA